MPGDDRRLITSEGHGRSLRSWWCLYRRCRIAPLTSAAAEFSQKGSLLPPSPVLTIISEMVDTSVSSSKDWKSISANGFHFAALPSLQSGSNFMTRWCMCSLRQLAVKFHSSPLGSKKKMLCFQQMPVGTMLQTPLPERVGATSRMCSGPLWSMILLLNGFRPTTKPVSFEANPAALMSFSFAKSAVPWLVMRDILRYT